MCCIVAAARRLVSHFKKAQRPSQRLAEKQRELKQQQRSAVSAVLMLMKIKKRHLVVYEDDGTVTKTLKITLTEEIDR